MLLVEDWPVASWGGLFVFGFFFFNLCCLGVALLLCVRGYAVTVIWHKTSAM